MTQDENSERHALIVKKVLHPSNLTDAELARLDELDALCDREIWNSTWPVSAEWEQKVAEMSDFRERLEEMLQTFKQRKKRK